MKTVGLVVEYNPFHNGHLYHLTKSKEQTKADVVIAVMSGSFLQRGEPALVSKWQRTNMALAGGVDILVELPYYYSVQKAQTFAEGAIRILNTLSVDTVCFGSESGDITSFYELHEFMTTHKEEWDNEVKKEMSKGLSYPKAASNAFTTLTNESKPLLSLAEPNNILGFHYVEALHKWSKTMRAETILRTKAQYHDEEIQDTQIASATSIRKALFEHESFDQIRTVLPQTSYEQLLTYGKEFHVFHDWEAYFPLLQYQVLSSSVAKLEQIYECEEGLEYRLKETIKRASSFKEWMHLLKTKRYTWSRLQRLATHVLTQTTKTEMSQLLKDGPLPYIRLLGMSQKGQAYLSSIKKDLDTPLISRLAEAKGFAATHDERISNVYKMALPPEIRAQSLYDEYKQIPIRGH
ncbi:hypothetical protein AJ85_13685 [Alkalihalobacillus alcalophilus ATCC 27647 = CGMCC 1.3604]|uniref:tRNA(Met) cytidine acetate ligase n=1 Tax=Alkalihalobacillus alcalophilus ATCC 27647 = CGMCC 1.3604 TaxID=1218173 RepID=A0A094YU65_ALKAL|nr:nucleotidyltransferase [Alkalihalobacillus alcalophilus]KGA97032.1 hypothetical protein BALCAV_0212780 [Alkalihalobacillus alcalophilus ATCC 27647 = CGMCC 1.3604]MED1563411.1 nucleotidyltransferase [Alkalihalobacillus alcalophilus]THG90043.1 hypothetical protein AJ85_13685 [Alkalihalobacillus alcalophilus ATCC 27647 = CGMCC 1.3604]